jgi:hypothetical protein
MKDICELIELEEFELDAVAGGNPVSITISAMFAHVSATLNSTIENNSANAQENSIDNSINLTGP